MNNDGLAKIKKLQVLLDRNIKLLLPADEQKTKIVNNIQKISSIIFQTVSEVVSNNLNPENKEDFIKQIMKQKKEKEAVKSDINNENITMPAPSPGQGMKESNSNKQRSLFEMTSAAGASVTGGINLTDDDELELEIDSEDKLRKEIKESVISLYFNDKKSFKELKKLFEKGGEKDDLRLYKLNSLDETGFGLASQTYNKIKNKIQSRFEILSDVNDLNVFSDGILKNINSLCDEIESNMESGDIIEEPIVNKPNTTGESMLIGVFLEIRNDIEKDYRSLLTSPDQRKSYKENLLNIIKNDLLKKGKSKMNKPKFGNNNTQMKGNDDLLSTNNKQPANNDVFGEQIKDIDL
jgi:hypothetical protein